MRCQSCYAVRGIDKPLAAEECPQCGIYKNDGLITYGDLTRCEDCFRMQLYATKQKNTNDAKQSYIYECPVCECGTVWLNKGHFSQCEECNLIGTNADDFQCKCGEFDFLYSKKGEDDLEAKCSNCL